jgi:hypothetical protein
MRRWINADWLICIKAVSRVSFGSAHGSLSPLQREESKMRMQREESKMRMQREESKMRTFILISACLAMTLGLFGCQPMPNTHFTIWYQGGPVEFDSPYDAPYMYFGPGGSM